MVKREKFFTGHPVYAHALYNLGKPILSINLNDLLFAVAQVVFETLQEVVVLLPFSLVFPRFQRA